MHPMLVELSKRFDRLSTREELLDAISDLEEIYDSVSHGVPLIDVRLSHFEGCPRRRFTR